MMVYDLLSAFFFRLIINMSISKLSARIYVNLYWDSIFVLQAKISSFSLISDST